MGASVQQPLHTITSGAGSKRPAGAAHALGLVDARAREVSPAEDRFTAAALTTFYSSNQTGSGGAVDRPLGTVLARGQHQGLVQADAVAGEAPTEHAKRVASFLKAYYRPGKREEPASVDALNGFLVHAGRRFQLWDIRVRMLRPRELFRANGFTDDYIIDPICWYRTKTGRYKFGRLPQHEQVAKCGNAVCPPVAEAIVRANLPARVPRGDFAMAAAAAFLAARGRECAAARPAHF